MECIHGRATRVSICSASRSLSPTKIYILTILPLKGGVFHIQITLPKDYPFKPPTLSFRTKIYHPNVTNDERGSMCLGMLRADEWKPPNKIVDVLKLVRAVLAAPQADDAVETGIADEFKTNRQSFDKTARAWVVKYAK